MITRAFYRPLALSLTVLACSQSILFVHAERADSGPPPPAGRFYLFKQPPISAYPFGIEMLIQLVIRSAIMFAENLLIGS